MLKYIKNINRIDINKLDGIVEEYKNVLKKYQNYTDMTDQRLEKLVFGLNLRINNLKKYIENNKIKRN